MRSFPPLRNICFLVMLSFDTPGIAQEVEEHVHVKRVRDAHTRSS